MRDRYAACSKLCTTSNRQGAVGISEFAAFAKFLYTRCTMEHCMFHKRANGKIIVVVIAVNNLTLTSSSKRLPDTCKDELRSKLDITDLGPIHWLLGVEVKRNRAARTISLSQKAYIGSIITCVCLKDAPSMSTPMETGVQLVKIDTDTHTTPTSHPKK